MYCYYFNYYFIIIITITSNIVVVIIAINSLSSYVQQRYAVRYRRNAVGDAVGATACPTVVFKSRFL